MRCCTPAICPEGDSGDPECRKENQINRLWSRSRGGPDTALLTYYLTSVLTGLSG